MQDILDSLDLPLFPPELVGGKRAGSCVVLHVVRAGGERSPCDRAPQELTPRRPTIDVRAAPPLNEVADRDEVVR